MLELHNHQQDQQEEAAYQRPIEIRRSLFPLGAVFVTPGALSEARRLNDELGNYVKRHHHGDWGEMSDEDRMANDLAVQDGSRIFSAYRMNDNETRLWVITDAEVMPGIRLTTTVLLPDGAP